ncbi:threonine/serine exporter family protein, partial [Streptomyces sp. DT225]
MVAEPDGPDDEKPQSDEAHSAFSRPAGTGPAVPEEDHPTSEFALPEGVTPEPPAPGPGSGAGSASGSETTGSAFATPSTYSFRDSPPAFTPAYGVPMVRLTK